MEAFNSDTQSGLFNSTENSRTDDFLSGLSRAFTLANNAHYAKPRRPKTGPEVATAIFVNAYGLEYRVTIERA